MMSYGQRLISELATLYVEIRCLINIRYRTYTCDIVGGRTISYLKEWNVQHYIIYMIYGTHIGAVRLSDSSKGGLHSWVVKQPLAMHVDSNHSHFQRWWTQQRPCFSPLLTCCEAKTKALAIEKSPTGSAHVPTPWAGGLRLGQRWRPLPKDIPYCTSNKRNCVLTCDIVRPSMISMKYTI